MRGGGGLHTGLLNASRRESEGAIVDVVFHVYVIMACWLLLSLADQFRLCIRLQRHKRLNLNISVKVAGFYISALQSAISGIRVVIVNPTSRM